MGTLTDSKPYLTVILRNYINQNTESVRRDNRDRKLLLSHKFPLFPNVKNVKEGHHITYDNKDIEFVEVQQTLPRKIKTKMSDKVETQKHLINQDLTNGIIILNCFIPGEEVIFRVDI
ncbi:hypothetical protein RCL_jg7430.t1 [Rhizophagus clarus]|uniref:Uncharacterized protein n=1 Tax=Rhizophagus clarus TaxID=94130 RepID=A0A8H3KZR7_9GLOM|nr:hypothetical protein RCL_jg7430.t1 [Rhizophagus clarus]